MAWVYLPEGITKEQIDSNEPILLYPGGIEADRRYIINSRRRGSGRAIVFAFFDKSKLMDAAGDNGKIELQVVGQLKSGQCFYGTDTVWIKGRRWRGRRRWRFN